MNNKIIVKIEEITKSYDINIGHNLLCNADKYFNLNRKVLIVTDDNIPNEYIDTVKKKCKTYTILTLPHGEENKNFDNYQKIIKTLIDNSFTRSDAVVAIGGGMVGDMSAFAASTYMRGIDFYNIPTTLLSQVDSSIGGKTAIDFMNVKNIVGTFTQPKGVLIDVDTLRTLPKREFNSGLVEAIKIAATFDKDFFDFIKSCDDILGNIEKIISRSLELKKMVVENDEKEKGLRKVLNFGHTIGHAIEEEENYKLLHGECVGIGMLYFSDGNVKKEIEDILKKYNLPLTCNFNKEKVIELIKHDKKSSGDTISTIHVNKIGTYEIIDMSINEIASLNPHL